MVDTLETVVHAGAMAGGDHCRRSGLPVCHLDPAMVARQGKEAPDDG